MPFIEPPRRRKEVFDEHLLVGLGRERQPSPHNVCDRRVVTDFGFRVAFDIRDGEANASNREVQGHLVEYWNALAIVGFAGPYAAPVNQVSDPAVGHNANSGKAVARIHFCTEVDADDLEFQTCPRFVCSVLIHGFSYERGRRPRSAVRHGSELTILWNTG